jgi:hypothetical protein
MTHQDGTQQDDASQVPHQNFTHNLEHAEAEAAKLAAHAAKAHPMPHEGHHF